MAMIGDRFLDREEVRSDRARVEVIAPLSGEVVPIELVPDPVFSKKMFGDGVAIDPLDSILRAPCGGEITQIHSGGHAITVRTVEGIEVLLHVGLDTVRFKGRGFTPLAKVGERVSAGAELIEFDLDFIARHGKSVLTIVVVTTLERGAFFKKASGMVVGGKDPIFSLELKDGAEQLAEGVRPRASSNAILIPNRAGLHARPAAVLANVARTFRSDIRLYVGERYANAKSVTAIMELDVRQGAKVVVVGEGSDAREAIPRLSALIEHGLGYEDAKPSFAPPRITKTGEAGDEMLSKSQDPNLVPGVAASPGAGAGTVFQVRLDKLSVKENAEDPIHERELLQSAIEKAQGQLEALQAQLRSSDPAKAAMFAAHFELLEDPDVVEIAISAISKGKSAAFAWKSAYTTHIERLAAMKNQLLAQRADDLRDVGLRVLQLISGVEKNERIYPAEAILVAEDLTLSDAAELEGSKVIGICTVRGGATSNVGIFARLLQIPAVAGAEPRVLEIPDGTPVILDGSRGFLRLSPSKADVERIRTRQNAARARRREAFEMAHEPAITRDDHRIRVAANIGAVREAEQVEKLGGEGVGLMRSEFLFLERTSDPTEDEQFEIYKKVAQALGPELPLIIRTLDVGGGKSLAYLPIPAEENPFLGERGIRVGLDNPEFLRSQLRAVLRASPYGEIRILFPMIGTVEELRDAKALLREEAERLGMAPVPAGVMIEIPSAALMATQIAKEVEFFSIGTNDLTQYTLAMDRDHPRFAPLVDSLNPAVLQLIADSVAGAHSQDRWVSVSGAVATDTDAVPILLGLGVDELSLSLPAIPLIKAQIRSLELARCRQLAEEALQCSNAAEVRSLVADLPDQSL